MKIHKATMLVIIFQTIIFSVLGQHDRTIIPLNGLKQAVLKANPGDTLYVKNGNYRDLRITLNYSGKDNVVIMAEEPGKVVLSGKSTIIFEGSNNIVFRGVLFNNISNPSSIIIFNSTEIEVSDNYFFKCGSNPFHTIVKIQEGSSRNKICNNTFEESRAMSVVVRLDNENDFNNTHNEICGNIFYDIPNVSSIYTGQSNGMEAIQLGQGPNSEVKLFTKIYNNRFEKVFGDGAEIISNKSSNNEIFRNVFLNNKSGITLRTGDNVAIFDNYIENTSQGIRIFGSGHKIYNNYITDCAVGIQIPSTDIKLEDNTTLSGYNQQNNIQIYNNIIMGGVGNGISIGDDRRDLNPTNLKIKRNSIVVDQASKGLVLSEKVHLKEIVFRKNSIFYSNNEAKPESRRSLKNSEIRYRPTKDNRRRIAKGMVGRGSGGLSDRELPNCPDWRCPNL